MRRRRYKALIITTITTACMFMGASIQVAHAETPERRIAHLVIPTERIDGLTGPEVQSEAWFRIYTYPTSENPALGNGDRCVTLGRHGKVLLPFPGSSCTARQGTAVWVFGINNACSNIEDPPAFGATEAAQRRCAFDFFRGDGQISSVQITVDGSKATDIHNRRFDFYTPQVCGVLPLDNIFELPPQPVTVTSYGWSTWIADLPRGHHHIQSTTNWVNYPDDTRILEFDIDIV